ncbi:MAG: hypothetical protein A3G02_03040 [Candidatus Yanofskybacteria bacterium RIFCSPLOWO2_12_FULL_44_13b]|uniref:Translation elongation factor-like protein n=2 Tax=Candidatus Yanofskyibacteriota TaxID=1752733 RepID=A0A1F8H2E3_9BACT|nr:MAG: hypothetical protein UW14_C0007G0023 [Candidatus Yanofskybacteria bacterium GW2011_GWA2_44_10]KKT90035.1 MAG: hypothetical protein UW90_C0008G0024 [Candidatus Yanofskybacteria bacterium GW2011_GWB1_45_11]OGN03804.1 MAG: hypothetical protein A2657_00180 [Candidatus Yanofskybacteria bacterium RIFCSPHIGHO2_01_FULL_44_110b]OGN14701.1 MAG: hypothetical protein A3C01_02050 [Candidatus Yanofskybacteria bacterium RIFCSPHIGHO2_02_FULL_44_36b]OGN18341.1 MAG: hypothetical protein A3F50_00350 [Cand
MKKVGTVTHYYGKIGVAIIDLESTLNVGDNIKFQGHGADFSQVVGSMQIDHKEVAKAKKGETVGLKVDQKADSGAEVYVE